MMLSRLLPALIVAAALVPTPGAATPELVVDTATGQVIHAEEATRPWFPASTTKMMTAYVALRALKAGYISLDTPLVASSRAATQPPSKIGIRPGQEITLDNALKVLMVKSANDVAVVIAEGVGGSVDGFANLMNQEAARLGMSQSHFVNPHGLFNPSHVSSARDLAVLGRALLTEFPQFRDYWGIGAVQLGSRVMKNTNGLIGRYPGAEGMKTGFVCASGFNVVALANRGGRTMMAVVLGSGSGAERTIRTAQLLDKGFGSWGGGHGSLASLPGSGYDSAPNIRNDVCRRGRQVYLGEEEDTGGAISAPASDGASVYAVMNPVQTSAARTVGGTTANGRAMLGPRADLVPIPVSLGRAPGSTEVARGAGNGAMMPRSATAFAAPKAQPVAAARQPGAIAQPAPNRPQPLDDTDTADAQDQKTANAPLQLPGVITTAAPGAIGLRAAGAAPRTTPAAPGAIRAARPAPKTGAPATRLPETASLASAKAPATPAKTAQAKAAAAKAAQAKTTQASTTQAKATQAKLSPPKASAAPAPKAAPKAKKASADDE